MNEKIIVTSPNQLGSGNLPSGYSELIFVLSDGNWTKNITLPLQPGAGDQVVIRSSATYSAELDVAYVDLPIDSLTIAGGCEYKFQYMQAMKKWSISGTGVSYFSPREVGDTIPEQPGTFTFYAMADANWVPQIKLPEKAVDQAYIVIRSRATYSAKVSDLHMLYASTTQIKTGDEYVFKFLASFNGWVIDSAPVRTLNAASLNLQIPPPTSQTTRICFSDGNWIERVRLPDVAGNRDKISIKSSALYTAVIDPSNVNMPGIMKLHTGEQYDFFFIDENKTWQLMHSPDTIIQAGDIVGGKLSDLSRPRTIINFSSASWQPTLQLPSAQQMGTRVIVQSQAELSFSVLANGTSYVVSNGESVAFKVDPQGTWVRETITIDLLLLYSDKAAARLGADTMRIRLIEGFTLTNQALENSGANFRYRCCGIKEVTAKPEWKALIDPLRDLRSDPTVQGWRDGMKADGIYYEGTEDGCGLAWLRADAFNMIATGSINCGTTVMRHELGHNMGLQHGGESKSYNQGYRPLATIMAGNAIPYYSTPNRYTADYGIPMGIPDKFDAVRAMNEFSSTVAAYR
ncbi:hypothetical protein QCE63_30265 [Caballeronia sp. LZ065]|nr:hypothetical protein [Caballeronia sp. LZ065]